MTAGTLLDICNIAQRISNSGSLSSLCRSIEIGSEKVRVYSEYGNMELTIDKTGITNPVLLDTSALNAVCKYLPSNSEIEFDEKPNKLNWKCGNASGSLNYVMTDDEIPTITHKDYPWTPQENLGAALILAGSACQMAAVPFGLYGIVIEPDGQKLRILSSNSTSMASSTIEKGNYPFEKITVRPPVPEIIANFVDQCPNCKLDVTQNGIFIKGDWLSAHLPLGVTLDRDLCEIADKFTGTDTVAQIDNSAIKKFIGRAKLLSDKNVSFTVSLKIEKGQLILSHSGISSSTEEFFLASGLDETLSYSTVALPADLVVIPLQYVNKIVLDYMNDKYLVMRGENPGFVYIIGGE